MSRFVCGSSQFGEVCTLPARVHSWSNTLIIKLGNPCSHSCVKGIHLIHRGIVASLLRGRQVNRHAADQLCRLAEQGMIVADDELKPDLIVMGTHGHTGLHYMLLGSTADQVIRHAPCPVLLVRVREEERQS